MLTPASAPAGRPLRPRHRHARALWTDRSWRPVTVPGWARLTEPYKSVMTDRTRYWAVCLRLGTGEDGWYLSGELYLRPA